ncbi:MAG TPA: hypothetical protein VEK06_02845, partial [Myxococcota bacterium]|nr:hypothetical protein [Myxococcota bacterium]
MKLDDELQRLCAQYLQEEPDAVLRFEIEQLKQGSGEAITELENRMRQSLKFGTAGLRGRMQAGYNRMNVTSVYRFAYALGSVLQEEDKTKRSVVIGFDARFNGQSFANEVKIVLQNMGILVFYVESPIPTPLLAFATKFARAHIGVMITASHNPGYDNGIKLFNSVGAQVFGPLLERIEQEMPHAPMRSLFYDSPKNSEIIACKALGVELEDAYFSAIKHNAFFDVYELDRNVEIAYTALHGVGQKFFLRALQEEGFLHVNTVKVQAKPDGAFPTLTFPNPEEDHVLDRVYDLATERRCDFVFANDPDADRIQVA